MLSFLFEEVFDEGEAFVGEDTGDDLGLGVEHAAPEAFEAAFGVGGAVDDALHLCPSCGAGG